MGRERERERERETERETEREPRCNCIVTGTALLVFPGPAESATGAKYGRSNGLRNPNSISPHGTIA